MTQDPEEPLFVPVTIDEEAIRADAFDEGHKVGYMEGKAAGHMDGYRACAEDMVQRLETMANSGEEHLRACLEKIRAMR